MCKRNLLVTLKNTKYVPSAHRSQCISGGCYGISTKPSHGQSQIYRRLWSEATGQSAWLPKRKRKHHWCKLTQQCNIRELLAAGSWTIWNKATRKCHWCKLTQQCNIRELPAAGSWTIWNKATRKHHWCKLTQQCNIRELHAAGPWTIWNKATICCVTKWPLTEIDGILW